MRARRFAAVCRVHRRPDGPRRAPAEPAGQDPRESVGIGEQRDSYLVCQPLLADTISGTIQTTHAVVPLRRMLAGVDVDVG